MTLYLYKIEHPEEILPIQDVTDYSDTHVATSEGAIYRPLAEGWELSSKADCSETLRADWQEKHPTQQQRIDELEELLAAVLFGGEGE